MIQDTDMNADFHNGPNLGLEPTTPRQVRREYLTLVFEKPISPAVHAIFAAQEWVAASHYDVLQERDNYAREVAELRAENKRLREVLTAEELVRESERLGLYDLKDNP
jgi:hypothetical protein